jgi:hypothetical protein
VPATYERQHCKPGHQYFIAQTLARATTKPSRTAIRTWPPTRASPRICTSCALQRHRAAQYGCRPGYRARQARPRWGRCDHPVGLRGLSCCLRPASSPVEEVRMSSVAAHPAKAGTKPGETASGRGRAGPRGGEIAVERARLCSHGLSGAHRGDEPCSLMHGRGGLVDVGGAPTKLFVRFGFFPGCQELLSPRGTELGSKGGGRGS